jgi:signal transduction histidine kinase
MPSAGLGHDVLSDAIGRDVTASTLCAWSPVAEVPNAFELDVARLTSLLGGGSAVDQMIAGAGNSRGTDEPNQPMRVRRLLRRLPLLCGSLAIALGLFVLTGWLLGHSGWTTLLPGFPAMVANTAIMAALAGVSLILSGPAVVSRRRSVIARILAGAVGVIAMLTLAEYAFGRDIGIDELVASSPAMRFRHNPGRPSPQSAATFLLVAASLLTIDWRTARGKRPAEVLALLSGLLPLLALLGYLFEAAELYQFLTIYPYIGMGIASAVTLFALSVGLLVARADTGILSVLVAGDSGGLAARQLVASLFVFVAGTSAAAIGARIGLYDAPIASALIVLLGTVGGSAFVLRLSRRLSRLDAERTAAIQAREDVMGVVAHDLRNPLGAILMQASFLRSLGPRAADHTEEFTASIERAARRMNHLIQDLLDVTRMEAGRFSIEKQPVDPRRLLAEAVEAQKPLALSDKLELHLEPTPPLPEVSGDWDRLLQVLENLIGNAMKFTEPGGRITVGARSSDHHVRFWVSDTGHGIAPEDLPNVFDPFWQGRGSARRGAGLGLPIVKGIVEAHGGRAWVESTRSVGSTFSFTIPTAGHAP